MIEIFDDTNYYKFNVNYINIKLTGMITIHTIIPYNHTKLLLLEKLKLKDLKTMVIAIKDASYTINNGKITLIALRTNEKTNDYEIEVMMNFTDYYTTKIAI